MHIPNKAFVISVAESGEILFFLLRNSELMPEKFEYFLFYQFNT